MYFIGFCSFFKDWVGAWGCGAWVYVLGVLRNVVILLVFLSFLEGATHYVLCPMCYAMSEMCVFHLFYA